MVWRSGSSAPSRSRSCGAGSSAMPRRFAPRSGPSSRAITSTGCWRRMPTAALLRPGANGSPHSPQSGRPHSSILCPENPGRYRHTVLEFTPSLVGCMIAGGNHSSAMIRNSRECVINLPTTALTDQVVGIGNTSGRQTDKFAAFGLTAAEAHHVGAPLIRECHASFECRLHDDVLVDKCNFFIFEVVKAHVAASPTYPETLHYTGDGAFMVSGKIISQRSLFRTSGKTGGGSAFFSL